EERAVVWSGGRVRLLEHRTRHDVFDSRATAIDPRGDVVAQISAPGAYPGAVHWSRSGAVTELPQGGYALTAAGVNRHGQVAAYWHDETVGGQGFVWSRDGGEPLLLPSAEPNPYGPHAGGT